MRKKSKTQLEEQAVSEEKIIENEITEEKIITGATGAESGAPADRQINVRVSEDMKEYWERAAEAKGIPLSEFIREAVQKEAVPLLDCTHPPNLRKVYPWSERCMKCGTRIR